MKFWKITDKNYEGSLLTPQQQELARLLIINKKGITDIIDENYGSLSKSDFTVTNPKYQILITALNKYVAYLNVHGKLSEDIERLKRLKNFNFLGLYDELLK